MRNITHPAVIAFLLLSIAALMPGPAHASTFSCDGGIVSTGDSAVDLIGKCGQPAYKDTHQEAVREYGGRTFVTVEDWTYDLGPQQFMRIVTLKNGVISRIRTGNYGRDKGGASAGAKDCSDQIINTGDRKADVIAKCGEPFWKESHVEADSGSHRSSSGTRVYATVEEWTYNSGPNRFLRIITFRNGRVTDVRTGGYGFLPKDQR